MVRSKIIAINSFYFSVQVDVSPNAREHHPSIHMCTSLRSGAKRRSDSAPQGGRVALCAQHSLPLASSKRDLAICPDLEMMVSGAINQNQNPRILVKRQGKIKVFGVRILRNGRLEIITFKIGSPDPSCQGTGTRP